MRVKSLRMQNFRGFEDLTLSFSETEPTVFFGINGVGKSSVLDCLASLLFAFIGGLGDVRGLDSNTLNIHRQLGFSIYRKKDKGFIRLSRNDISNNADELNSSITVEFKGHVDVTCNYQLFRGSKGKYTLSMVEDVQSGLTGNPKTNFPVPIYYPVGRGVSQVSLEISQESWDRQTSAYEQSLQGAEVSFESFFRWYRAVEDLENENRSDNNSYQDRKLRSVRHAIYRLIPDFSNLKVRRSPPLRMTVNKKIGDGYQELTINQLSDGEKCLLAMVGDLARRLAIANPGLENPLEGQGVVLIDEIELHLHPEWQRRIISALTRTFPNCQFICTTHSPQVLSELQQESIYCLERTEEGKIVAYHPDNPYGRDSNYILEALMDVPERPQRIKDKLRELFRLIETGNLEQAKQLQQKLESELGEDEPDFARADLLIRRREAIGR